MTTARLSVHTLMGSKEVFRTKTLPFIWVDITRARKTVSKICCSRRVNGPRNRQSKDDSGVGVNTGWGPPGARGGGGAGGDRVIDEQDLLVCNQPRMAHLESAGDGVAPSLRIQTRTVFLRQ